MPVTPIFSISFYLEGDITRKFSLKKKKKKKIWKENKTLNQRKTLAIVFLRNLLDQQTILDLFCYCTMLK
jgi:hypothetical protein